MQYKLSTFALIGLAVLWLTSCSVSRQATRSDVRSQTSVTTRDTVREQVVVAVHDTLREVTTITVQLGQTGDTVRVAQVTERDRVREAAQAKDKSEKIVVQRDTVYVEKRDSVLVERHQPSTVSHQTSKLKWIFALICAVVVLVIVIKVCLRRR